jgi:glucose-1-phosphate adenylyltransferase
MTTMVAPHQDLHKKTRNKASRWNSNLPSLDRMATIILGGGEGKRLFPLTTNLCKPAINFGGRYRLIDIPFSNAINSGCRQIFVITQFLSTTLNQHIITTYCRGGVDMTGVTILSPEQKPGKKNWFEGTADAVRQNIEHIPFDSIDYVLILSGDQLYHLDYRHMMQVANKTDADLVLAALPIKETDCKRMGVLQVDEDFKITGFIEKPKDVSQINEMIIPSALKQKKLVNSDHKHIASMGIYLFKKEVLLKLLLESDAEDFGMHLIPTTIKKNNSFAYLFNDYWEDIGTIKSFYEANMGLTHQQPAFHCLDEMWPIFSALNHLPPAKISSTSIYDSIICEGCVIEAEEISNSIIGPRIHIQDNTVVSNSYIMGCDQHPSENPSPKIGKYCTIDKTIIDKNASIGNNVKLINKDNLAHFDSDNIYIRDHIIIVPRSAVIPDGFII